MPGWIREIKKLIRRLIAAFVADVHTHIPAEVISYNGVTNTCSLQPSIMRVRTNDPDNLSVIALPVLEDVPVLQRGSGKLLLSVAPSAGSYGLIHVSERNIENWMLKGGTAEPKTARKFDLSDAFFEPGAYPLIYDGDNGLIVPPIKTDRMELRTRDGLTTITVIDGGGSLDTIEIKNTLGTFNIDALGQFVFNSTADAAALASKVLTELQSIRSQHNLHIHNDSLGSPTTTPTVPMTAPSPVPSVRIKVDA